MSKKHQDATLLQRQSKMDREFDAKRQDIEARLRRRELTFPAAMKILHNLRAQQYAALNKGAA